MAEGIQIELATGAEDIGLSFMLQDLLTQNLEQNPHKTGDFKKLNANIGIIVSDADIALTLAFSGGRLLIHPGIKDSPGIVITAEVDTIMAMSNIKIKGGMPFYFDETGKEILVALFSRKLKIKGMFSHFPSLIRLSRVMSVH